jgi:hypothetical protein
MIAGGVPVDDEGGVRCLDLRGLEPPRPAVTILTFLDGPDAGDVVIVRLARDPIFLYPELAARGWDWEPLRSEPQDVRLRLVRKSGRAPT